MANYSHSKLSTFEQCKQKYKFSYIDGIKVEWAKSAHLVLGGVVHTVLEKLYKDLKYQKKDSLKELLDFYDKQWAKKWTKDVINPKAKEGITKKHFKKMGKKYITDYYKHYYPFNEMTILGIETEDRLKLKDGSSYHIKIDKLGYKDGINYVCDYKTDQTLKDQNKADQDRQLAMYSQWVKKNFKDAKKIVLMWYMVAFDKEVKSERTLKQLDKLENEVVRLIKQIETTKEYPTNVTNRCQYCEYKQICPSFKHEVEIEELPPRKFKKNEGVQLVDQYSKLYTQNKDNEEQMEEIKKDVIAFAVQEEIDRVYGSNKKISVKETQKIEYKDKEKLEQKLKQLKVYDDLTNINYLKLNSLVNKGEIKLGKLITKHKDYQIRLSNKKKTE